MLSIVAKALDQEEGSGENFLCVYPEFGRAI